MKKMSENKTLTKDYKLIDICYFNKNGKLTHRHMRFPSDMRTWHKIHYKYDRQGKKIRPVRLN